jgi:hypothetical protein
VSIERLAERHRRGTAPPVTDAHVVDDEEAGDNLVRTLARDVPAAPSHDEAELALVVELVGDTRTMNRIERPVDAGYLLVEEHRKRR